MKYKLPMKEASRHYGAEFGVSGTNGTENAPAAVDCESRGALMFLDVLLEVPTAASTERRPVRTASSTAGMSEHWDRDVLVDRNK